MQCHIVLHLVYIGDIYKKKESVFWKRVITMKNTPKPALSNAFFQVLEANARNSLFMRVNMYLIKFALAVGVVFFGAMGLIIRLLSSF